VADPVTFTAIPDIPMIEPGDDLPGAVLAAITRADQTLRDGDVLVIAQKVFSKTEGRYAYFDEVNPSAEAVTLAEATEKDPRLVELILSESKEVLRHRPGVIIVAHRLGMVMANAGIDASNIGDKDGRERVLLLPVDPDASAEKFRAEVQDATGREVAIIMSDSVGRAWRSGTVGIALGAAGFPSLIDLRGDLDLFGRPLQSSIVGFADEVAAAGSILQGQGAEGAPVVLARGLKMPGDAAPASILVRDIAEDLFR
jgi:coenzyme F420-0:L-glutamate ligase / coenzyme F420-1:gamma-L-glutamate ligase